MISTTIGCEGLAVRDGEHLLIADTPQDFAAACAAVLQDEERARDLANNARQLIVQCYDANVALQALDSAYQQALAESMRTRSITSQMNDRNFQRLG